MMQQISLMQVPTSRHNLILRDNPDVALFAGAKVNQSKESKPFLVVRIAWTRGKSGNLITLREFYLP